MATDLRRLRRPGSRRLRRRRDDLGFDVALVGRRGVGDDDLDGEDRVRDLGPKASSPPPAQPRHAAADP